MVLADRGGACNLSRTLMLVSVLVSSHFLSAHGFSSSSATEHSRFFPFNEDEFDQSDDLYGSTDQGYIGSIIRRKLILVRVPPDLRSIRSESYEDPDDLVLPYAAAAVKRTTKDLEELPDRTRILFLQRLYSSIGHEGDSSKTQRKFVGKRTRDSSYATELGGGQTSSNYVSSSSSLGTRRRSCCAEDDPLITLTDDDISE